MKSTLNVMIDPATMMLVAANLKNAELGRLYRALAAHLAGEDASQFLTNSGLRLAFALLRPSIDESLERLATNRLNGAKGGRPRKRPAAPEAAVSPDETNETEEKPTKKSKKEDLSPTPPIEEKNKKNNSAVDVVDSREREDFEQEVLNNRLRVEQACMTLDITPDEYCQLVRAVLSEWDYIGESDRSYKHLLNALRIKARDHNRNKHQYHGQTSKIRHDITDTTARSAKDYQGPF